MEPKEVTKHVAGHLFSRTIRISDNQKCILLNKGKGSIRIINIDRTTGGIGDIDFDIEDGEGLINDFKPSTMFFKLSDGKVVKQRQVAVLRRNGLLETYSYDLEEKSSELKASALIDLEDTTSEQPYTLLVSKRTNVFIVHTVTNNWSSSRLLVYNFDGSTKLECLTELDLNDDGISYFISMVEVGQHEDGSFTFCCLTHDHEEPALLTFNYNLGMNCLEEVRSARKTFRANCPKRLVKFGDEFVTVGKDGKLIKINYK